MGVRDGSNRKLSEDYVMSRGLYFVVAAFYNSVVLNSGVF